MQTMSDEELAGLVGQRRLLSLHSEAAATTLLIAQILPAPDILSCLALAANLCTLAGFTKLRDRLWSIDPFICGTN